MINMIIDNEEEALLLEIELRNSRWYSKALINKEQLKPI